MKVRKKKVEIDFKCEKIEIDYINVMSHKLYQKSIMNQIHKKIICIISRYLLQTLTNLFIKSGIFSKVNGYTESKNHYQIMNMYNKDKCFIKKIELQF